MTNLASGMKHCLTMTRLVAVSLISCSPLVEADEFDSITAPGGWSRSFVVGIAATPSYFGDDRLQGIALPDVQVAYDDRFRASLLSGAEFRLLRSGRWSAGPTLRYDFGRDERKGSPLVILGSEIEDLLGLSDVNGSFEAGGFLSYDGRHWQSAVEVRQGLGGGHEGLVGVFDIKYTGALPLFGRQSHFEIGPELLYGDEDYNQTYFGITADQSRNSGLSPYVADAGIVRYGIHADLLIPLNQRTSVGLFAGFDRLGSPAADSPLIIERGSESQLVAGLFVTREF